MSPRKILFGSFLLVVLVIPCMPPTATAQRVRAVATPKNVELRLADDVIVRFQKVPRQFDDKGKPIKPTAEQLKALKGDPKQPGYAAELSDLKTGQLVRVYLGRPNTTKKETDADQEKQLSKPGWIPLGELTGRVAGVHGPAGAGAGEDRKTAGPTLVITVETVKLTRARHDPGNPGKVTFGPDVVARKVMILQDAADEKAPAGK
jgi:hypothetical protein